MNPDHPVNSALARALSAAKEVGAKATLIESYTRLPSGLRIKQTVNLEWNQHAVLTPRLFRAPHYADEVQISGPGFVAFSVPAAVWNHFVDHPPVFIVI